jgi:hypothetical protein
MSIYKLLFHPNIHLFKFLSDVCFYHHYHILSLRFLIIVDPLS